MVLWFPSLKKVFITEMTVPREDSVEEAYVPLLKQSIEPGTRNPPSGGWVQRVCANVYHQTGTRPGSQRLKSVHCHQKHIRESREKQSVALDDVEGPLLGPQMQTKRYVGRLREQGAPATHRPMRSPQHYNKATLMNNRAWDAGSGLFTL